MSERDPDAHRSDAAFRLGSQRAPATYVNYFELGQNQFEFLIDLGQYHPGIGDTSGTVGIHTRLVLTPPYAKMLSDLLSRSVHEHEREYGSVTPIGQESPFDIILSSLGEFEERARNLRASNGGMDPSVTPNGNNPNPSRNDR